jgi:hypothetical protein
LKSVDFPTFGKPTIPHFKPMISFFIKSGRKYKRNPTETEVSAIQRPPRARSGFAPDNVLKKSPVNEITRHRTRTPKLKYELWVRTLSLPHKKTNEMINL